MPSNPSAKDEGLVKGVAHPTKVEAVRKPWEMGRVQLKPKQDPRHLGDAPPP